MRHKPSYKTIQKVLNFSSERTTFRRVNDALNRFAIKLKNSINSQKVEDIMKSENWIVKIRQSMQSAVAVDVN